MASATQKNPVGFWVLIFFVVVFGLATTILAVLYGLKINEIQDDNWRISISPCLTPQGGQTCGEGVQRLLFTCPSGKICGPKPPDFEQPCLSNALCTWNVQY